MGSEGQGGRRSEETESKRYDRYAEAILWYLDHPEAPLEPNLRAMVEAIRKRLGKGEAGSGPPPERQRILATQ